MGDWLIECGEEYQKRHPGTSWEQAMAVMTSDLPESKEIGDYILQKIMERRKQCYQH